MSNAPSTNEYLALSEVVYQDTSASILPPGGTIALSESVPLDVLLDLPGTITEYDGMKVIDQSRPDEVADGFSAIALEDASGNIIIVNEGTVMNATSQFGRASLAADLQIGEGNVNTPALVDAAAFAIEVEAKAQALEHTTNAVAIYVTGHSLGGIEAEKEAQTLTTLNSSDFAAGATFGATGLPRVTQQQAQNSPQTLIDYVERGDVVGNFARDTETQTPNPIAPQAAAYHYGDVQELGSVTDAAFLKSAQANYSLALQSLQLDNPSDAIAGTDGYAIAAVASDAQALAYHS